MFAAKVVVARFAMTGGHKIQHGLSKTATGSISRLLISWVGPVKWVLMILNDVFRIINSLDKIYIATTYFLLIDAYFFAIEW